MQQTKNVDTVFDTPDPIADRPQIDLVDVEDDVASISEVDFAPEGKPANTITESSTSGRNQNLLQAVCNVSISATKSPPLDTTAVAVVVTSPKSAPTTPTGHGEPPHLRLPPPVISPPPTTTAAVPTDEDINRPWETPQLRLHGSTPPPPMRPAVAVPTSSPALTSARTISLGRGPSAQSLGQGPSDLSLPRPQTSGHTLRRSDQLRRGCPSCCIA